MTLAKAMLISDDGVKNIEFMFNPNQLSFEGTVETAENAGARTQEKGKPKVSFANIKAYQVTISNIIFDTYEEGDDVVKKYIDIVKQAVEFAPGKQRTPIYQFIWGSKIYLRRCFVEKLSYKLTMFLPDGTPVRAVIDSLSLKEADEQKQNGDVNAQKPTSEQRKAQSPFKNPTT